MANLDKDLLHFEPAEGNIVIQLEDCVLHSILGKPEQMLLKGCNLDGTEFESVVSYVEYGKKSTLFESISGNLFQVPNPNIYYYLTDREEAYMIADGVSGWACE